MGALCIVAVCVLRVCVVFVSVGVRLRSEDFTTRIYLTALASSSTTRQETRQLLDRILDSYSTG